jgi:hypothetical protein
MKRFLMFDDLEFMRLYTGIKKIQKKTGVNNSCNRVFIELKEELDQSKFKSN